MPDFGDVDPYTGQTNARTQFEGTADPNAPSVSNGMITPEQWEAYQRQRRWAAIRGILGLAGATTGLGFLGQAIGGGAGALASGGGGEIAVGSSPFSMSAPTVTTAATGGGIGAGVGSGIGVGGAAGGAARTFLGMSPRDLAGLGLGLTGAVGGAMQNRPNTNPNTQTQDPNLQRLLATMQGRLDKSEPLYDSIMAMANGLLPTRYQRGGGPF